MVDKTEAIANKILCSPSIGELVLGITEEACRRFRDAGVESDFCLQYVGPERIVFGGTNRVMWSPRHGFEPDEAYCTERFLRVWCFGAPAAEQ